MDIRALVTIVASGVIVLVLITIYLLVVTFFIRSQQKKLRRELTELINQRWVEAVDEARATARKVVQQELEAKRKELNKRASQIEDRIRHAETLTSQITIAASDVAVELREFILECQKVKRGQP